MSYFSQVKQWNDERDNTVFNRKLEARMLLEEWFEFLGYNSEECRKYSTELTDKFYEEEKHNQMTKVASCDALGDICFIAMGAMGKLTSKGDEIFRTIQEANNQKSKTKNAEGKITKPANFIPPEFNIRMILEQEENSI